MQISSFLFLCFFTLVLLINFLLPRKIRWAWLLLASYVFCAAADFKYVLVLLFATLISYFGVCSLVVPKSAVAKKPSS
jgi:D-alanyl-lipoteichoic acid acyltransferase DltB (MBOAT superfamily)